MIRAPIIPDMSVLVVDESHHVRRLVAGMLHNVGIRRIDELPDTEAALLYLAKNRPGLIIIDWWIASIMLVEMLRDPQRSVHTSVPIIAMIAKPTKRLVVEAARVEVRHMLVKPFAPSLLWSRIATFFSLQDGTVGSSLTGA